MVTLFFHTATTFHITYYQTHIYLCEKHFRFDFPIELIISTLLLSRIPSLISIFSAVKCHVSRAYFCDYLSSSHAKMVLQIFVLSIFFISLFNKAIACPLGCSCNGELFKRLISDKAGYHSESSISCTFLTKPELYVFLEVLKDSPFNETTDLSLASIDNFWLRMLPDMPKLRYRKNSINVSQILFRVLKVQSSPSLDDSDWFLRRNQFPELQTLHFKNCSLKVTRAD